MMRLGILSDVHGDLIALEDALAHLDRLGCELIVCAGDLVDYGAYPEETLVLLRDRGIPTIRGNHDRWALQKVDEGSPRRPLSSSALAFLRSLPTRWDRVLEGVRVAVRHGTPKSDMEGIDPDQTSASDLGRWLREAEADVLIVGHTHVPFALTGQADGLVVNPGALLRDVTTTEEHSSWSPPAPGTFGVLELPSRMFRVYRAGTGMEVEVVRRCA